MNLNEIMKRFEDILRDRFIASEPLERRDQSRLLVIDREKKKIHHRIFYDIVEYFNKGDCLVINTTKVVKTRVIASSEAGGKREVIFLPKSNTEDSNIWRCLGRKLSLGRKYFINEDLYFKPISFDGDGGYVVEFNKTINLKEIEERGTLPLPHYILKERKRLGLDEINPKDDDRYQTIYASSKGSIAAPTAGFHFSDKILTNLKEKGVLIANVILHIGYGTFKMVREDPEKFIMPKEYVIISKEEAEKINTTKRSGRKIFVVGTSSMRAVEKMNDGKYVIAGEGYAEIFIKPGWEFKIPNHFITNLHLPHSPPLYMTLAFMKDPDLLIDAYTQAVQKGYRFYSYGDCSLIL